jgi:ferric-dicitrate binding protein FerR (iron transport regulator)
MNNLKIKGFSFITVSLIVLSSCSSSSVNTKDNFEVLELPDGSLAFLNRNSEISYDEKFSPRSVEVQGEVFFSVVEGKSPFVVKSEHGEIAVLGTEFNVKSSIDELEVEVQKGVVELKTATQSEKVKRGEAALYRSAEKEFTKAKAEFKFKIWMKELKAEFKKLGKEIKSNSKKVGKESKKAARELKKELKKLDVD